MLIPTRTRRLRLLAVLLLMSGLVVGAASPAAAQSGGDRPDPRGQAAIDRLGERLPLVAQGYGMTPAALRAAFLSDSSLSVDAGGRLFYVDRAYDAEPASGPESSAASAPPTTDPVFDLHSRPGADHVIYLDFDGHTTTGTSWNSNYGIDPIVSPPYDIDGDSSTWSAEELSRIRDTWEIVTEDFAPFDIDVTTAAPPVDRLIKSGGGDTQWGVRVVITADTWANCGCGGHAYIDSFNSSKDTPVFVYNSSLIGVAEASSHEVGHAVGLSHDGTNSTTYYRGHGDGEASWAPIMGVGYYESVTQWSKGEYYQANNGGPSGNYGDGPDDLLIMTTQFGFGYRPDDHADGAAGASLLAGGSVAEAGVIEQTSDVDVFMFTTGGGIVSLSVDPAPLRPNLNVLATLRDAGGAVVSVFDSTSSLAASINMSLTAGTYYLEVDGTGTGSPLSSSPTGYTEYGSLGQYTLSGSFPACVPDGSSPATPTGLTATPNDAEGWIDLAWSDGQGGADETAGYHVYRDGSWLASSGVATYRDATAANNVSHSYHVVAYDDCGEESGGSAPALAMVQGVDKAVADFATTYGSVSGSFQATWSQDDSYQSLTESQSGGRPSGRHDRAEQVWQFDLTGGNTVFNVDAYVTESGDGDDGFVFEWSTNATGGWQPLLTVTKTSDDDALQVAAAAGASGTIFVRAYDNDRTGDGAYSYNTLRVDQMYFDGGSPPSGPPGQATNPVPVDGATDVGLGQTLAWDPASEATSYDVCFGTSPDPTDCTTVFGTSYDPGGLASSETYHWRVDSINSAGTTTGTEWSFTTAAPSTTLSAGIVLGTQSGSRGQKYGVATVTVTDGSGAPVAGVSVDGMFTGEFSDDPGARVTGADGSVTFVTADQIKKPSFGFCLSDVELTGYTWDGGGACAPLP